MCVGCNSVSPVGSPVHTAKAHGAQPAWKVCETEYPVMVVRSLGVTDYLAPPWPFNYNTGRQGGKNMTGQAEAPCLLNILHCTCRWLDSGGCSFKYLTPIKNTVYLTPS